MSKQMLCPILGTECTQTNCAWFDDSPGVRECAVLQIAKHIRGLDQNLDRIEKYGLW